MELERALTQIADIRRQMSLACQFRGFRAATTLFTGAAAVAAAMWQASHPPEPAHFILLWVGLAVACIGICAVELIWRYHSFDPASQQQLARVAVAQFIPFVFVGGLLTLILWKYVSDAMWMLPGLWQVLFGLGLCSLRQMFPKPILYAGGFYILCGLINLTDSARGFSPWSMGIPFGLGQAITAIILYWYLERKHAA